MSAIIDITAREILDSRGNPTVEVDVILEDGTMGRAAVPSGASTGAHEAVELRDGDKAAATAARACCRPSPRSTARSPRRCRRDATEQVIHRRRADRARRHAEQVPAGRERDPRRLARRAKAAADFTGQPLYRYVGGTSARVLPVPMMNIINGGQHADNPIDIQEFMIMPVARLASARRCGWAPRSSTR
jgi:enolase